MEKQLELQTYAKMHGDKIISVTESWATAEISDGELAVDGFVLFRKDRNVIRDGRGGGVTDRQTTDGRAIAYGEHVR